LDNGRIISSRESIEINPGNRTGASNRQNRPTPQASFWSTIPKQAKWGVAVAAVLIVGLFAYQISQIEHRYYADIQKTKDASKIKRYLRGYPEGVYRAAVTRLQDSLDFEKVYQEQQGSCDFSSCDCSGLGQLVQKNLSYEPQLISAAYEDCLLRNANYRNNFPALTAYREAFPQGRYLDTVNAISDQLWAQLRHQYLQRISTQQVSAKARQFFQQLLDFGQSTGQLAIRVNFGYELALKDWEDYHADTYSYLDMLTEMKNAEQNANFPKPSSVPPPSIRNYFRSSNNDLQQMIVNALQSRLDSVFTPNPFQLKRIDAEASTGKAPTIQIDYKIETLAETLGNLRIPTLYVQQRSVGFENASNETELELRRLIARSKKGEDVTAELQALQKKIIEEEIASSPHGLFQGYLLATSIDWDMQFSIPDSETKFAFQTISKPNSSFSNIQSNQDAYRRMMESTFVNYAVQLAEGFGI
jgi:hypothetical protein